MSDGGGLGTAKRPSIRPPAPADTPRLAPALAPSPTGIEGHRGAAPPGRLSIAAAARAGPVTAPGAGPDPGAGQAGAPWPEPVVDFAIQVAKDDPDLFVVPADARREDIARQLLGDPALTRTFDFVPARGLPEVDGLPGRAVRVRDPGRLTVTAAAVLRAALEQALGKDVRWTVDKLSERRIDPEEELNLAECALRWSQRSDIKDSGGTHYFDRYLNALDAEVLVERGLFSDTTKTALQWLLIETEEQSEQVRKAVELRSSRSVGYRVTDRRPELAPGDVIGRFYWGSGWSSGGGVQVRVALRLTAGSTPTVADDLSRWWNGLRVVVPAGPGLFVSYGVVYPMLDPLVMPPETDPAGHFYWYHPGTILLRGGLQRLDPAIMVNYRRVVAELRELFTRKERLARGEGDLGALAQINSRISVLVSRLHQLGIQLDEHQIYDRLKADVELRTVGGQVVRTPDGPTYPGQRLRFRASLDYLPPSRTSRIEWELEAGDWRWKWSPMERSRGLVLELDEQFWNFAPPPWRKAMQDAGGFRVRAKVYLGDDEEAAAVLGGEWVPHVVTEPGKFEIEANPPSAVVGAPVAFRVKHWAPAMFKHWIDWEAENSTSDHGGWGFRHEFSTAGRHTVKATLRKREAGLPYLDRAETTVEVQEIGAFGERALREAAAMRPQAGLSTVGPSIERSMEESRARIAMGGEQQAYWQERYEAQQEKLEGLRRLAPEAATARDLPADLTALDEAVSYSTPIPTVIVYPHLNGTQPVAIYLTVRKQGDTWAARLVDVTGALVIKFDGSGKTVLEAITNAFADWRSDNPYPRHGTLIYSFSPPGWSFPKSFSTSTTWKDVQAWVDGILAIGAFILGGLLLMAPDLTVTKVLGVALIGLGVARSTVAIIQNLDLGMEPLSRQNVLEGISILTSMLGAGGSVLRAVGAQAKAVRPLVYQVGTGMVVTSLAGDLGTLVYVTADALHALRGAMADPTLDESEKDMETFRVLSGLLLNAGVVFMSNRDLFKRGPGAPDLARATLPPETTISRGARLDLELELRSAGLDSAEIAALDDRALIQRHQELRRQQAQVEATPSAEPKAPEPTPEPAAKPKPDEPAAKVAEPPKPGGAPGPEEARPGPADPVREALLKEAEQRVADAEATARRAQAHAKEAAEKVAKASTELEFYEAEAKSDVAKARAKRAEARRLEKEAAARRKNPKRGDPIEAENLAKEADKEADRLDMVAEQARDVADAARQEKRDVAKAAKKAAASVPVAERRAKEAGESHELQVELSRRLDALEARYRELPEVRARPNIEPPTGSEAGKLKWEIDSVKRRLYSEAAKAGVDTYTRLRAASPGPDATKLALENLDDLPKELRGPNGQPIDVTTGKEIKPEDISPDHIYALKRIAREPGFNRLTPEQQLEIAELTKNYMPMTEEANSSKGGRTMEEWFKTPEGSKVPPDLRKVLIEAQERARTHVREQIEKMIKQNESSSE